MCCPWNLIIVASSQQNNLLSAQEAKGRLREIIEDFFFWRLKTDAGKRIKHLLVKSPPGLGKTTEAIELAIRYQAAQEEKSENDLTIEDNNEAGIRAQTAIFVPRHQLADEVRRLIECAFRERGTPITVPILRGRENGGEEGNAPCQRWREARELGRKGLPIYTNLCQRKAHGETFQCRYFAECEYIQTRQDAYRSPFVILVHSHLGLEWGPAAADRLYDTFAEAEVPEEGTDQQRHFKPTQANIIVCDEDPTISLVEETRLSRSNIRGLADDGLEAAILAGIDHPSGLLSHLRERGVSTHQLRGAAERARAAERSRGQIANPDRGNKDLAHVPRLVRLSRVLERLADELACGRQGDAYSLVSNGDALVAQGRQRWSFDDQRLLLLDGTANPVILRKFVPQLKVLPEIRVQRNAWVVQVKDRTFYRHSLIERATSDNVTTLRRTARLAEVAKFIAEEAREGRTLVVTNKPVRCALTGENAGGRLPVSAQYEDADIAHFGNIRGIDEFKEHDTVIILGREQPSARDAERRAMAIWYDTRDPIRQISPDVRGRVQYPRSTRSYTVHSGAEGEARVRVHPDPRVQAVVEQTREAEMVQAIDRLRLIHNEQRKTVYILCNIPLDIPVDELVTWRELIGDSRLSERLATCEEEGWEALPLAAKELSRLFPKLWATKKAAERWLAKNPLASNRTIIRIWGVLTEYRPLRQKSWSTALIRDGVEDRASELGKVLGICPELLRFRDSASGKLVTSPSP